MCLAIVAGCFIAGGSGFAQTLPIFNVKNFGAAGDGTTIDTPAINAAITAANAAGGGTVTFPPGNYLSVSIHLTNNVTLYLSNNAVILAAANGFDDAEPNPWSSYQDYGHSHFHDALIWGEDLSNIGFAGPGTINGNAHLLSGDPPAGSTQADKAISLKSCTNVVIAGITITRAGHFGILANGCQHFTMTNTTILNATLPNHRDAINLINSSHCYIANCQIEGSDDAMCLKADYALGQKFANTDIQIENCTIRSTQNNATQFGSETVGDFSNVRFANLNLIEAGKAGIGITSNDGSIIDGLTYDNITMTNCACTIHIKLSDQNRPSSNPHPVGRIRNVSINNVTARHSVSSSIVRTNTATIAGFSSGIITIPIENIVLSNVNISTIGGNPSSNASIIPPETQDWQPNGLGVRPSYGWYIRHANNISLIHCQTHFDNADGRPALIADDVQGIKLDGFVADVNATGMNASPYDLGFTNVTAYDIANATGTNGSPLRISSVNSASNSVVAPPFFNPASGVYTNAQSVTLTSATPGAVIRYTTDGSTPTPVSGTIYSGSVNIGNNIAIRAVAYAGGKTNSAVNTAIYDFTSITPVVAPPFFNPPGGIYAAPQSVTISSATDGASIRYTTDGTVPGTNSGTLYSTPVVINSNVTLKAIAYATNLLESPINTAIYGITFAAATPAFSPPGGVYTNTQLVTLASATSDASIHYTTDGSTPTSTSGTPYSLPVTVNSNLTVKAIAYAAGATDSPVAGATYTIASPPPAFVFEAELIPFITSGAPAILQNDVNNSGGHWLAFEATGSGQFIQYTVTNIPAGTYDIQVSWKGNSQRGISSFALDGTVLGVNLDQYSSTQIYPTTDYGIVTFPNGGNHDILLTCVGKNSSANGYWISTDHFIFIQLQAGPPTPPNFGSVKFSGADILFQGGGGVPQATYCALSSTNLALPMANWSVIATHVFDAVGNFTFTNAANPGTPNQFYLLKYQLLELP